MKIRQLGSTTGLPDSRQHLTTFLINDCVAVDAGCLGYVSPVSLQRKIEHVFISHCHIDHIGSLPVFLDNVYSPRPECPHIYAGEYTLKCLETDIFNERVWPDLGRIAAEEQPFMQMHQLHNELPVYVAGMKVTPISVNHVVPTFGFLIEDESTAVMFVSDTGPTDRIWEIANSTPGLSAIFLECSFPDDLEWLASKTKHLSPNLFQQEISKFKGNAQIIAVHIKAAQHETVTQELMQMKLPQLTIGGCDFEISLPLDRQ
ncbi:MAG: 3',5'-cyclic-nucleotide phosphodiesterase [Planctomyces sp.]